MSVGSFLNQIVGKIVNSAGFGPAVEGAGKKLKKDQREYVERHPSEGKMLTPGTPEHEKRMREQGYVRDSQGNWTAPQAATLSGGAAGNVASVPMMITRRMRAQLKAAGYSEDAIRQMTPQQAQQALGGNPLTREGAASTIQASAAAAGQNAPAPLATDIRSAAARIAAVESGNAEPGGQAVAHDPFAEWKNKVQQLESDRRAFHEQRQAARAQAKNLGQGRDMVTEAMTSKVIGEGLNRRARELAAEREQIELRIASRPSQTPGPPPSTIGGAAQPPLPPRPPTTAAPQPEPEDTGAIGDRIAQAAMAALNAGAAPPPEPPAGTPGAPPAGGAPPPMQPPGGGPPPAPPPPGTGPSPAPGAAPKPRSKLSDAARVIYENLKRKQDFKIPLPEHTVAGHTKEIMGLLKKPEMAALFSPQQLFEGLHELIGNFGKKGVAGLSPLELTPAAQKVREFAAKQTAPLPEDEGELRKTLKPLAKESGYGLGSLFKGAQELKQARQVPEPAVLAELAEPTKSLGKTFGDLFAASKKFLRTLTGGDGLKQATSDLGDDLKQFGKDLGGSGSMLNRLTGAGVMATAAWRIGLQAIRHPMETLRNLGNKNTAAGKAVADLGHGWESIKHGGRIGRNVGGVIGGLTGPEGVVPGAAIGFAVGTFVTGLVTAEIALKKFADSTLESRREFAKFNATIGYAFARLSLGDIRRSIATGQNVAPSTAALADAINDFRDDNREVGDAMKNLANLISTGFIRGLQLWLNNSTLAKSVRTLAIVFNWLMREDKEVVGPWQTAIKQGAEQYRDQLKNNKIKLPPQDRLKKPPWPQP